MITSEHPLRPLTSPPGLSEKRRRRLERTTARPGAKRRLFGSITRRRNPKTGEFYSGFFALWTDHTGRRHLAKAGYSREEAELFLEKKRQEVLSGQPLTRELGIGRFALAEFLPGARMRMTLHSFYTVDLHLRSAQRHFGERPMRGIQLSDMEHYFAHLKEKRGLKPSSLRRHRASLLTFWEAAIEGGVANRNPLKKLRLPRVDEVAIPYLTPEELQKLYAAMPERIRALVIILGETGLRRGEALRLTWQDVLDDFHRVVVRKSKTGKVRYVPLTPLARETLLELHAERPPTPVRGLAPVFPYAATVSVRTLLRDIRRRAVELGYPEIHFQAFRHVFASSLVQARVPIPTVARLLGHSSPQMVLTRYGIHAPANEGEMAIEALAQARGQHPEPAGKPSSGRRTG